MKNKDFTKQKLELLSLKSEFQKDVFLFRKKWKIPKNGFKNDDEAQKHDYWLGEISDNYRDSEPYNKKRHFLFKNLNVTNNKKFYEEIKELEMKMPLNDFFNDQKIIALKYKLSANYNNALDIYLRTNNFDPVFIPKLPIRTWYDRSTEDKSKKKIFIEIYAETTIKDVQTIWPIIKRWQTEALGYRNGRKKSEIYFDLHKKIYELHTQKIKSKEIAEKIKNEFNRRFSYDEINKIINRFKKGIKDT